VDRLGHELRILDIGAFDAAHVEQHARRRLVRVRDIDGRVDLVDDGGDDTARRESIDEASERSRNAERRDQDRGVVGEFFGDRHRNTQRVSPISTSAG
jgi:hypothetical protein